MTTQNLKSSSKKVQDALQAAGFSCRVRELPGSTRTAEDAAKAVGCQVGQIVKSLVFKTKKTKRAVLVEASGANRVNEKKLAELLGEKIRFADVDFVRQKTGFAIGGVPPIGHTEELLTFVDEDLHTYDRIWAAAGTPNSLFGLTPDDLVKMTGGQVVAIK
jgi:Cys-tRNA(Pro) deacylase